MTALLLVAAGMALLVLAAELLVRAAVRISTAAGVPTLVVGLTVVAFGGSAPELFLSVGAAVTGNGVDIAVGNVVGSGISNGLVILGIAAFFGALTVHLQLVRLEVPLLILVTFGTWWMAADGEITRLEGIFLLLALGIYTTVAYLLGRDEEKKSRVPLEIRTVLRTQARAHLPKDIGFLVVSFAGLLLGARLTIVGASDLAAALGVEDLLIGLTVVAVGTSLPELVTSVVAVRRGQSDIAVGNVVGSNLFNLLGVFGTAAVVGGSIPIPEAVIRTDFPVALLVTLIIFPVMVSGLKIERWEGTALLAAYAAYVGYLIIESSGSPNTDPARLVMFVSLIAVSLLMLAVGLSSGRRSRLD